MSEKPRHPKLEIETNVPVTVTLGKKFYDGTNEHGKYYGYNLTHDGEEKVIFASPYLHEQFQKFRTGQTLQVTKRQRAGEKSITWEIGEAGSNGSAPTKELKYEPSTFNREAYREQRTERLSEAFSDAIQIRDRLAALEIQLTTEDLRSIAISFVIEENRDRVPLTPVEKPPDANIPALLEEIKKTLTDYIPGTAEIDQTAKGQLLEKAFRTSKWQPVTQMNGDELIEGLAKLRAAIAEEEDEIPF